MGSYFFVLQAQFQGVAATIASLVAHAQESIDITLVTPEAEAQRALDLAKCAGAESARVVAYEATNATRLPKVRLDDFTRQRDDLASTLNYVRFYLGDLLLNDEDPALYLDSDVASPTASLENNIASYIYPLDSLSCVGGVLRREHVFAEL